MDGLRPRGHKCSQVWEKTRLVLLLASSGSSCGMEPITFDLNHPYRFFFSPKHLAGRAGGKSRTKNIHKP